MARTRMRAAGRGSPMQRLHGVSPPVVRAAVAHVRSDQQGRPPSRSRKTERYQISVVSSVHSARFRSARPESCSSSRPVTCFASPQRLHRPFALRSESCKLAQPRGKAARARGTPTWVVRGSGRNELARPFAQHPFSERPRILIAGEPLPYATTSGSGTTLASRPRHGHAGRRARADDRQPGQAVETCIRNTGCRSGTLETAARDIDACRPQATSRGRQQIVSSDRLGKRPLHTDPARWPPQRARGDGRRRASSRAGQPRRRHAQTRVQICRGASAGAANPYFG